MRISISNRKNYSLYIFVCFFLFLFVLQFKFIPQTVVLIFVIILMPLMSFQFFPKKINKIVVLLIIMYVCIIAWSTEIHKSFLFYFIMIEALIYIRPEYNNINIIMTLIKKCSLFNALFVILELLFPKIMYNYAKVVYPSEIADGYVSLKLAGYNCGLNYVAGFIAFYLALGLFAYIFDNKPYDRGKVLKVLFLCSALIATNKRSCLLYFVVALLFVYYYCGKPNEKINRVIKISVLVSLLLISIPILANLFPNISLFDRMSKLTSLVSGEEDANSALSGRVAIYNQVMDLFHSNEMFGIGWENFTDYSRYTSLNGKVNQGHNVFLQLLCETGIVGFTLFFTINALVLRFCFKSSKIVEKIKEQYKYDSHINGLDSCRKCAIAFMVYYYLFWFSGNALYDFSFVYAWTIAIHLCLIIHRYDSMRFMKKEIIIC